MEEAASTPLSPPTTTSAEMGAATPEGGPAEDPAEEEAAEDLAMWAGLSQSELVRQCAEYAGERSRVLWRIEELQKERDAGLWEEYREDRLQEEIDRELAAQKVELSVAHSKELMALLAQQREELVAKHAQELQNEVEQKLKVQEAVIAEKNDVIKDLEFNRKSLVDQIRKLSQGQPASPAPAGGRGAGGVRESHSWFHAPRLPFHLGERGGAGSTAAEGSPGGGGAGRRGGEGGGEAAALQQVLGAVEAAREGLHSDLHLLRRDLVAELSEVVLQAARPAPAPGAGAGEGPGLPQLSEKFLQEKEKLLEENRGLQAEVERLRAAAVEAQGGGAAAAEAAAMQKERDDALAALERQGKQAEEARRAAEALQAEVGAVRARLAESEERVESGREMRAKVASLEATHAKLELDFKEVKARYDKEYRERRALHNAVLELKGNIRVFARLRPLAAREQTLNPDLGGPCVTFPMDGQVVVHKSVVKEGQALQSRGSVLFEYDRVFEPAASQADVFAETRPLLQSVVDGYNVTVFAYGQTGAGKTHTMTGTAADPGLCPSAVAELLRIAETRDELTLTLSMGMMEVYNESVRDLLSPTPKDSKLTISHKPDGSVDIPELITKPIGSPADFEAVYSQGTAARATGATNMNLHSSRSHLLCLVGVQAQDHAAGGSTCSKLYLVDLAGSERVGKSEATGDRLKEAQAINKSLSAITDVISALQSRKTHVPYRNSKLTYILSDSLGGSAKVLMFCNASPSLDSAGETLSSLHFASRARSVELGPAARNPAGTPGKATKSPSAAKSPH